MNEIQLRILRRCNREPQWVTGFVNVKLVIRGLIAEGFLISKSDPAGGLKYHITHAGERVLKAVAKTK